MTLPNTVCAADPLHHYRRLPKQVRRQADIYADEFRALNPVQLSEALAHFKVHWSPPYCKQCVAKITKAIYERMGCPEIDFDTKDISDEEFSQVEKALLSALRKYRLARFRPKGCFH